MTRDERLDYLSQFLTPYELSQVVFFDDLDIDQAKLQAMVYLSNEELQDEAVVEQFMAQAVPEPRVFRFGDVLMAAYIRDVLMAAYTGGEPQ